VGDPDLRLPRIVGGHERHQHRAGLQHAPESVRGEVLDDAVLRCLELEQLVARGLPVPVLLQLRVLRLGLDALVLTCRRFRALLLRDSRCVRALESPASLLNGAPANCFL
jgi:hypothetical protein